MFLLNNHAIIIVLISYLVALFGLNIYFKNNNSNHVEYNASNRKMGPWTMALSISASDNSGWLFLGLPGAAYLFGFNQIWIIIGLITGCYFNWLIVAPYLQEYVKKHNNIITVPDFFENEFNIYGNQIKWISSLLIIIFSIIYISANIVGLGILFEQFNFFSYHTTVIITSLFIILYVSIGGFSGICNGDILQAIFMILSSLIVPIIGFYNVNISQVINFSYNTFSNINSLQILSLLSWGLGYFGQPHILSRFMAIENKKSVNKSKKIALLWSALCWISVLMAGIIGSIYFDQQLNNPEIVFILLAQNLLNIWLVSMVFVSISAAIISTITAQVMVSSNVIVNNIMVIFISRKNLSVFVDQVMVVAITLLSAILAWHCNDTVLSLLSYAWAGLGASFGPLILFISLGFKISDYGALMSILVGSGLVVAWRYLCMHNYIYEMLPAFVIACFVLIFNQVK